MKFFPAEAAGGVRFLEALAGPFETSASCRRVGSLRPIWKSYLGLPQVAACGGSWMVTPELTGGGQVRRNHSPTSCAGTSDIVEVVRGGR